MVTVRKTLILVLTCVGYKGMISVSKTHLEVVLKQFLRLHFDQSTYFQIFCCQKPRL